jgi:hypothetical protein
MLTWSRSLGALLVAGALTSALPVAAAVKPPKTEAPIRAIAIVVNGDELASDPAPRVIGGRLMVPVVRVYNALGIAVSRDGKDIVAAAPSKTIVLHIGSKLATIDSQAVMLESPALEIDGATYVPLRFIADSLGAAVTYSPKAARVEIVSSLVGRMPSLTRTSDGGLTQIVGTVTAVDLNSVPEAVTIEQGGLVRSVSINSDAKIVVQDVVTKTSTTATLNDIHPGDAVSVYLAKDGKVEQFVDRFASRTGTVAAVSPTAIVLQNGVVLTPDRDTTITLNGAPAFLTDVKVGDAIVVRSNPDTGEKREMIVSRAMPATPQAETPANAVAITSITSTAKGYLHAGDTITVTLKGTSGGNASFDIGTYVVGVAMHEEAPGVYTGTFKVPPDVNFGQTPLYGHLNVGTNNAPRAQATGLIAVSTTPPQITDVAPPAGQTVNNSRPSIFATYSSPTDVGINANSVTISVNGHDVTASAVRAANFITYSPSLDLPDGTVTVKVLVFDNAGNKAERSWSFTIRSHDRN